MGGGGDRMEKGAKSEWKKNESDIKASLPIDID